MVYCRQEDFSELFLWLLLANVQEPDDYYRYLEDDPMQSKVKECIKQCRYKKSKSVASKKIRKIKILLLEPQI